ncbi:MAG: GTPase [Candidatus Hydrogenedentota bacterium]
MSESLAGIVDRLRHLAAYEGPWRPLREEAPRLRARVVELRERETRLDDLLVVALVGGSGVGKSTLLNAIAGDQLAETSEFRPCTGTPTVYHPPGTRFDARDWRTVSGSALEHLVVIDTPDSDTVIKEHRETVQDVLAQCDLILICGSPEKYLDEATWSLLRPLQAERTMACVETKARKEQESVKEHWLKRLGEQGFAIENYFRLNARATLDRKLTGKAAGANEFDWAAFEAFLGEELTRERVRRIKRSNAIGLLTKTVRDLHDMVGTHAPELAALEETLKERRNALAKDTVAIVRKRLFAERYLWTYALSREIDLRALGIVQTLYRLLDAVRSLPMRLAGWLPGGRKTRTGRQAAVLLSSADAFQEGFVLTSDAIQKTYEAHRSELSLAFAQAGFDELKAESEYRTYETAVSKRVAEVLRGPARDRIVNRAQRLTSWPVALALDVGPLAFLAYMCYRIVVTYFNPDAEALRAGFLNHSVSVLAIILIGELLLLSLLMRSSAWTARNAAARDLRYALSTADKEALGFEPEAAALREARALAEQTVSLAKEVLEEN